jgi:hypothetical protein
MQDVDAPIELLITEVTSDDLADAFAMRDRHLQGPLRRWALRLGFLATVLAVGYVTLMSAGSPGIDVSEVGILVFAGVLALMTLRPKRMYRMTSRRIVRDNAGFFAPATVTITDSGIQRRTPTGQGAAGWEHYKVYAESNTSFVLFLSDRPSAAVEVLPKRALTTAGDVERMRVLLDRHVKCVTR